LGLEEEIERRDLGGRVDRSVVLLLRVRRGSGSGRGAEYLLEEDVVREGVKSAPEEAVQVAVKSPESRWRILRCGGKLLVAAESSESRWKILSCGRKVRVAVDNLALRQRVLAAVKNFQLRRTILSCGGKF
jgi:hypothetical protein